MGNMGKCIWGKTGHGCGERQGMHVGKEKSDIGTHSYAHTCPHTCSPNHIQQPRHGCSGHLTLCHPQCLCDLGFSMHRQRLPMVVRQGCHVQHGGLPYVSVCCVWSYGSAGWGLGGCAMGVMLGIPVVQNPYTHRTACMFGQVQLHRPLCTALCTVPPDGAAAAVAVTTAMATIPSSPIRVSPILEILAGCRWVLLGS